MQDASSHQPAGFPCAEHLLHEVRPNVCSWFEAATHLSHHECDTNCCHYQEVLLDEVCETLFTSLREGGREGEREGGWEGGREESIEISFYVHVHTQSPPPPPKKKKQPTKKHALTSAKGSGQGGSADVLKLPGQQESGYVVTLGLTSQLEELFTPQHSN